MRSRSGKQGMRGKPLVALALVLGSWGSMRYALWQSPFAEAMAPLADAFARIPARAIGEKPDEALPATPVAPVEQSAPDWALPPPLPLIPEPVASLSAPVPTREDWAEVAAHPERSRRVVGHNMLFAAGFAQVLWPANLSANPAPAPASRQRQPQPMFAPRTAAAFVPEAQSARRWSADGWMLLRDGTGAPAAAGAPSYGRSQIGAVMRYRLDPASPHAPQAHLRASAALAGGSEREVAAGLSARPLPHVPVRVAAEARLRDGAAGDSELRAGAYAVSEMAPMPLPGGAAAEVYVQAGYVSGRNATGFVDGQARVARDVGGAGPYQVSLGGGAWGGAQEGAGRLDLGPSVVARFRLGETNARVSADYRIRVAGEAAPTTGPAITLSAGF